MPLPIAIAANALADVFVLTLLALVTVRVGGVRLRLAPARPAEREALRRLRPDASPST
jgi:hypothetical protein